MDGLVQIADANVTTHVQPGQLEAETIDRIENTREGSLVVEHEYENGDQAWQLRKGEGRGWTR